MADNFTKPVEGYKTEKFQTSAQRYEFVTEIKTSLKAGVLEADIFSYDGSEVDQKNYHVWSGIALETERDLQRIKTSHEWVNVLFHIFHKIFTSGLFFIALGLILLNFAISIEGREHASFVFILVVLGVALVLYGTGTQAVGSFKNSQSEDAWKANVSLAGGAGIIALITAAGMVYASKPIREAFLPQQAYARLSLSLTQKSATTGSARDLVALATFSGTPIPHALVDNRLEVLLPYETGRMPCAGLLRIELSERSSAKPLSDKSSYIFKIVDGNSKTTNISASSEGLKCEKQDFDGAIDEHLELPLTEDPSGGREVRTFNGPLIVLDSVNIEVEPVLSEGNEQIDGNIFQ